MIPRSIFAVALLASSALAAPSLTTIQDVLYKADGTRFTGSVSIAWNSFQAGDRSSIMAQSTTVRVVDGNLRVQLVPTTGVNPAVYYTVTYNSDGRMQFQETWAVPASGQSLRVRDVRIATPSTVTGVLGSEAPTPIHESDVIGLTADLDARPLKGPAYAVGRVAMVNPAGSLESVTGSPTDCVRVDGSSGPCGPQPPSFVDGDSPYGIVDGSNLSFTLSAAPDPPGSLALYRNGLLQKIGQDYTFAGAAVQFVTAAAPQPGDTLLASYRLSGTEAVGSPLIYSNPQVLCSGIGAATGSTTLASLGDCNIPAGILAPGDRVQILLDFEHQGATSGFSFEIHWGAATLAHRDAAASDVLAAVHADASILPADVRFSFQSWGTVLPLSAGVAAASGDSGNGAALDFQGKLAQAGDTLTLRNFTVVRLP